MTGWLRSAVRPLLRMAGQRSGLKVRMTTHCCDQTTKCLQTSVQRGHEGIVYFVGLTNGATTMVL